MKKKQQSAPQPKNRVITFTRNSSIEEHEKLGKDLIAAMKNLEAYEAEKSAVMKVFNEGIKAKKFNIAILRDNLDEHKITLTEEVHIIKDYIRGMWVFVDRTTGEEVLTEAFNDSDIQATIEDESLYEVRGQQLQIPQFSMLTISEFPTAPEPAEVEEVTAEVIDQESDQEADQEAEAVDQDQETIEAQAEDLQAAKPKKKRGRKPKAAAAVEWVTPEDEDQAA